MSVSVSRNIQTQCKSSQVLASSTTPEQNISNAEVTTQSMKKQQVNVFDYIDAVTVKEYILLQTKCRST